MGTGQCFSLFGVFSENYIFPSRCLPLVRAALRRFCGGGSPARGGCGESPLHDSARRNLGDPQTSPWGQGISSAQPSSRSAATSASVVGAKGNTFSFGARLRGGAEGGLRPPFVGARSGSTGGAVKSPPLIPHPRGAPRTGGCCAEGEPCPRCSAEPRAPARARGAPPPLRGRAGRGQAGPRRGKKKRSAARRRKKHGAGKQYVQNPQGIAVNSFLFEENLQLGNRPFYDLFGLVIGCGWSCAGSERFHGLFLISLANFPLHSAFREPQPLFS